MDLKMLKVYNTLTDLGLGEIDYAELEAEIKDKDKTGIYIHSWDKKGNYICVNHDKKMYGVPQIVVKQLAFQPIKKGSRIMFKTLIDFKVPNEIFVLHSIGKYKCLDTEIISKAKNLEHLKNIICERFSKSYAKELGKEFDEIYDDDDSNPNHSGFNLKDKRERNEKGL
jgi:hypothetical protein